MYIVVLHISAICATFLKIYSIICSSSPLSFVASTKAIRNILCYFTSIRVILIVLSTNSLSHTQTCTRFPILVGVGNGTYDVDSIRPDMHEPVIVLLLDILRIEVQERLDIFDFLELGFAKGGKT